MARTVRCGLIQTRNVLGPERELAAIKKAMIDRHVTLIGEAARKKVKILCLQELFYGPYFCAEQETRWYQLTERVPDGPTITLMRKLAKKHQMVIVVPIYEEEQPGIYYNTAAVIDADGHVPRQVPQDAHPALQAGLLGEVLLPARQPRLSGVRDGLRESRRLHLLRPALPRRRARARPERRGDRLQPVGDGRRPVGVSLEARAAGARRRERLLRRRDQPRRHGGALEHRRVLRTELLLRPARPHHRRGAARQGRRRRRRPRPRHDRRSAVGLAVLPRPPARCVWRPRFP